ncbi:MAG: FtsX-like permease family protein [Myxococcales bacterium]|nr:ABC transporter permease [Myxococcales bacterium]HIM00399.1 ABC transporter permease [Myxococcales bacterium]
MDLFAIAWRNVFRNTRRSFVTVAAMGLALLVMILYSGLIEGYLEGMERNVLDLEVGDLQIFAQEYRVDPSIYTKIDDPQTLLDRLDEAGFDAASRLLTFGLVAADEASSGASFRGVNVARDALVSDISNQLDRGHWLDPGEPKGVVIGRRLARTLDVDIGGELLALTQDSDGSMAYELFEVRGVLLGISDSIDRSGIFMVQESFRELITMPEGAHQIIVRRPGDLDLPSLLQKVEGLAFGLDVKTWRQLMPTIASMLDAGRGAMVMMGIIIYMAVAILILNAMLMAVFERIQELGVLKAIGFGPLSLFGLILIESGVQTFFAIIIGLAFGIPGILYLASAGIDMGMLAGTSIMGVAMDPIWRAAVHTRVFTTPIIMLVTIVFLAILYPAGKAALIRPSEAMRHS